MRTPKFSTVKDSFHTVLKNKVSEYFQETGKSSTGNFSLFLKASILLLGLIATYIHLIFFTPNLVILSIVECALLGGFVASIGFNIMHDGAHGSFSRHTAVNKMAAVTLNILGGNDFMWNVKHNVIHHAYTNIDGVDDDLDARPLLRMASTQKAYKLHRFQHLYFWFVYSLLYLYWIFASDYRKYFRRKVGDMPLKKMFFEDHFNFWFYKIIYYTIFVVIPILELGFTSWLIGFVVFATMAGLILSVVFQLAHTVEHTHFPVPDATTNRLEDEWAVHQLKTTANFATKNRLISWLVGGLNFQIEHHLFPKISHIHYPAISKIIKRICAEYQIQYVEYPRMYHAVQSHIAYLKKMGKAPNI